MQILTIPLTKGSAFGHCSYNVEQRTLLTWLRVDNYCTQLTGIPFEVARSFPTGITGLTYYLMYLKGRYPCARVEFLDAKELDPSFEPPQPPAPIVPHSERIAQEHRAWLLSQGRDPEIEAQAEKLRFEEQAARPIEPVKPKPSAKAPKARGNSQPE